MSLTSRLLRAAFTANRLERAARNPARYVKNRAKSRAMSKAGIWRAWWRWWRAKTSPPMVERGRFGVDRAAPGLGLVGRPPEPLTDPFDPC
jgi:hypothetical protein